MSLKGDPAEVNAIDENRNVCSGGLEAAATYILDPFFGNTLLTAHYSGIFPCLLLAMILRMTALAPSLFSCSISLSRVCSGLISAVM